MQNKERRTNSAAERILNVVIGVVFAILLLECITLAVEVKSDNENYFTSDRMLWSIEDELYNRVISSYYEYGAFLTEPAGKSDRDLCALAEYADATFKERAFRENGLTKKADAAAGRREAAKEKLGMYEGEAEKVDKLYGNP